MTPFRKNHSKAVEDEPPSEKKGTSEAVEGTSTPSEKKLPRKRWKQEGTSLAFMNCETTVSQFRDWISQHACMYRSQSEHLLGSQSEHARDLRLMTPPLVWAGPTARTSRSRHSPSLSVIAASPLALPDRGRFTTCCTAASAPSSSKSVSLARFWWADGSGWV